MIDKNMFDAQTLREVYVIIDRLEMKDRIPTELLNYMTDNQDLSHKFDFNESAPLIDQLENEKTKILLAYLIENYIK